MACSFSGKDRFSDLCALRDALQDVPKLGETDSLARAINPMEGVDEKNGAKQNEQQIG